MVGFLIDDGTIEDGYIAERKGLHPALRFRYRPMLHWERDVLAVQVGQKPPREVDGYFVTTIRQKLVSWDAKDKAGTAIPIRDDVIQRLRPALFDRLYNVIAGASPSDPDPARQDHEQADAGLKAVLDGRSPGDVQQESHEGNSERG